MLSQKRIFDPLYGTIHLSEFEYELIQLPEVQRLREVRMCNINSLLITGASQISRFEHSIGVMYLAKVWLENNKKYYLTHLKPKISSLQQFYMTCKQDLLDILYNMY